MLQAVSKPYLLIAASLFSSAINAEEKQCRVLIDPSQVDLDRLEPPADFATSEATKVGKIDIFRQEIYPPTDTELAWYESGLNYLNPLTKIDAIRAQLVIAEGDRFDQKLMEISERQLREQPFLYNARVFPYRVCEDTVDLAVVTRDLWTFLPALSITRSGGQNKTFIGFSDVNFAGSGKTLFVNRQDDNERTRYLFGYSDPAVWDSAWQADGRFAVTTDGELQRVRVKRPFSDAEERNAYSWLAHHEIVETPLYFRGDEVNEFRHQQLATELSFGTNIHRPLITLPSTTEIHLLAGYRFEEHQFRESDETQGAIPDDRLQSYPWLAMELDGRRYMQAFNINQNQQVEDVALGWYQRFQVGYSSQVLGATGEQIILSGFSEYRKADERTLYSFKLRGESAWDPEQDQSENTQLSFLGNGWWFDSGREKSWHGKFELTYTRSFTLDNQLVLGGSTGLRGYPADYQVGDRRVILSLERRYFWPWYPLRTFRVGGVAFIDSGRAWFENRNNGVNGGILTNIGFGLRITSSRIQVSRVVHLDLAFPLQRDDPDIDRIQFIVKGEASF